MIVFLWQLMINTGFGTDCSCYGTTLVKEWNDQVYDHQQTGTTIDVFCFKYSISMYCDPSGSFRGYILGTANAKNRCGVQVRPLIYSVTGAGTPRYSVRTKGPLKLQGIVIDQGLLFNGRNVKVCFRDTSINETAKFGYISYADDGSNRNNYVSCDANNILPDFCSASGITTVYIGDEDAYVIGNHEIDEYEEDDAQTVLFEENEIDDMVNDGDHSIVAMISWNGIVAVVAVSIMVIFVVFMKCVKPKLKDPEYEAIPSNI